MNPVRANMVKHPGEYRWSSYAVNATDADSDLITPHTLFLKLGDKDDLRKRAYRSLFEKYLNQEEVHSIREALNQELVLGREDFKIKIEKMTNRQTKPGKNGRPRKIQ